jgi:hypothetical protein
MKNRKENQKEKKSNQKHTSGKEELIQRRHLVTWIRRVVLSVPSEAAITSSQFVVTFR